MVSGKGLFAFWRYDQPPFFLGAPVLEILKDGRVKVEGYQGFAFKPVLLLPVAEGELRSTALDTVRRRYAEAYGTLRSETLQQSLDIIAGRKERG